jgi:hypothetical protein
MTNSSRPAALPAGVWFSIKIESEEFIALLSKDALEQHFLKEDAAVEARAAYRRNRKLIDSVARRKFLEGCPRPIKVEAADFG